MAYQSEHERIVTTIRDTTKVLKSPTRKEILDFLATPKGRVFMEVYRESQYLTIEELKELRQYFTDRNTIIIIDCLIRERKTA